MQSLSDFKREYLYSERVNNISPEEALFTLYQTLRRWVDQVCRSIKSDKWIFNAQIADRFQAENLPGNISSSIEASVA